MFFIIVLDISGKYGWVILLKDITSTNAFQKILSEPNDKPNKIHVDKSSEFCNSSVKSWLQKNNYRNVFNT